MMEIKNNLIIVCFSFLLQVRDKTNIHDDVFTKKKMYCGKSNFVKKGCANSGIVATVT